MADGQPIQTEARSSRHPRTRRVQSRVPRKIRYTSAEWEAIVECAHACGKPPAEYVRDTSLGAAPKVRHGRENEALIRDLCRIGTALAGLARTAKETGALPEAAKLDAALAEVLAAVRRLG